MRTTTSSCLAAGLMMAALLISPAFAGTMAMGGTGGVTEPLRVIGQRFSALSGGGVVDVVPGLGSGGAISAAADGVLQVAVSGRPLTAVEAARGLTVTSVVCTPYVLATSRPEPASLDRGAIAALYAQTAPRWAAVFAHDGHQWDSARSGCLSKKPLSHWKTTVYHHKTRPGARGHAVPGFPAVSGWPRRHETGWTGAMSGRPLKRERT